MDTIASTVADSKWPGELVESLLYMRMHKYGNMFVGTKGQAQLTCAWTAVLNDFNRANNVQYSMERVKNKFQVVKRKFDEIRASEAMTGNPTEKAIVYPTYWPALVEAFGDLSGRGNRDYGQTGSHRSDAHVFSPAHGAPAPPSTPELPQPIQPPLGVDGTAEVTTVTLPQSGAPTATQQKQDSRKRKMDLGDAVALMAQAYAKRMERSPHSGDINEKFSRLEEQISSALLRQETTMRRIERALSESSDVNKALLRFLTSTAATRIGAGPDAQQESL
ncbi:hypothetical protein PINS_up007201 [Pythium insidiosum]|nr:hypothetical protein PINS_up007201 [Pythium insidiosum]